VKLLFDQNVSPKLADNLSDLYPGSIHVQSVGLDYSTDNSVWEYARQHEFIIVTKDVDFSDRSALKGYPPKIIWLRIGNCTTSDIEIAMREKHAEIMQLHVDDTVGVLVLLG
jgi:predicted nuclease of predicted toxin-antitoxin system